MKNLLDIKTIFLSIIFSITISTAFSQGGNGYSYTVAGGTVNSHGNINPSSGTMLIGGAEAGASAEINATNWFIGKANGGDYLVIRTGGTGGQANWVWNNFNTQLSSAAELSIDSRSAANNSIVAQYIRDAEAIFIAGGDQTSYMENWKDTEVEAALNFLVNEKSVPIAGTSAGMAILGGAYYAPASAGILSSEILNDPYHPNTTNSLFYNDFLSVPYLGNVITETHLNRTHGTNNENRYGRAFGLLARSVADLSSENRYAIACEEGTFVCVNANGIAKVYGNGSSSSSSSKAYFLQVNCNGPETIQSGSNLVWNNNGQAVKAYVIQGSLSGDGNSFNLNDWLTASGGGWMNWFTSGGYNGFNFINGSGASLGASVPNCSNPETCSVPSSVIVSSITEVSATAEWLDANTSFQAELKPSSSTTWDVQETDNNTVTYSGLQPNTIYDFRVKTICGSSESGYSAIVQFSTLQDGAITPSYCNSSASSTQYEYIDEVAIGNDSNFSGDDGGYGDYTNFTFNVNAGSSYQLTIYPETKDEEIFLVWADFNQDGDFLDSGEEIFYERTRRTAKSTIIIPTSALSGNTRIRVAMRYANAGEPGPCQQFEYGEVEDYTLQINNSSARTENVLSKTQEIASDITVYPNPASNIVNLAGNISNSSHISIYDLKGKVVKTGTGKNIDISLLTKGVYLLEVTQGNALMRTKIIKD